MQRRMAQNLNRRRNGDGGGKGGGGPPRTDVHWKVDDGTFSGTEKVNRELVTRVFRSADADMGLGENEKTMFGVWISDVEIEHICWSCQRKDWDV